MYARKRPDLDRWDLLAGILACFTAGGEARRRARVEACWPAPHHAFACLSVRSGLDAVLVALDLPRGSEVLLSALTIPGIVRVFEEHGLVPVPLDLELDTMLPSAETVARAVGPRSRVLMVAHLFGARGDLEAHARLAREHGLLFFEDCAQAYSADGYAGHPGADVSFFSFGPIKSATALGGAVLSVRDDDVREAMRSRERVLSAQGRLSFFGRTLKYAAFRFLTGPRTFGLLAGWCRLMGRDLDTYLHERTRGFSDARFLDEIRRRPSAPLLALLERRLASGKAAGIAARQAAGARLARHLGDAVALPGVAHEEHVFWVFPVLAPDPDRLVSALREAGFDATRTSSLVAVEPPPDRPRLFPRLAHSLLPHLVFLPADAGLPAAALDRQAEVVLSTLSAGSGHGPG